MRVRGAARLVVRLALATPAAMVAMVPTAAAASLTLSPAPGTPDASPSTQISILGPAPGTIQSVAVNGTVSGRHAGHVRAYSANRGASYLLTRPLAQGEAVHVRIRIAHRKPVAFTFTVARLGASPSILSIPLIQPAKLQRFTSQPGLRPPKITVLRHGGRGDIFLTPTPAPAIHPESNNAITVRPVGPGGPMIIDSRGRVVWFDQLTPPVYAINFRPQTWHHRQVLTWWQGTVTTQAFGEGEGVIADTRYRTMKTVHTGNGYGADLHEFVLTPDGDALFTAYSPVRIHLPGTPAGTLTPLLDAIVQEVDVGTGLVTWEWHAYGHIPLSQSLATPANSADFDAYHINSIQPLAGDRVLISARDTSAVYLVDRRSGRIVWTLGGSASTFRLAPGARFWFQHDAQILGGNEVSLFDDEAGPPFMAAASRGLILRLDTRRHTAAVARQFHRPGQDTLAQSEGSLQPLAGGNAFVGFGSTPFFSEFTAGGSLVFDAALPTDDGTYRAYRFPWSATPTTRPAAVIRRSGADSVNVYVSWNGATTVSRWQVRSGARTLGETRSAGFETSLRLRTHARTFVVRALDRRGHVLSTSRPTPAS